MRYVGEEVIVDKNKVMAVNGEEGFQCEVYVYGISLEHVLKFKYLGCVLDESGTDGAKCSRKVVSGRRVPGAIRSLFIARDCSLSVLESCMKHCFYLLCMGPRQYCERRREI